MMKPSSIWNKRLRTVPNDPTIMEHLGDVYFKKGMFKKSLEMYEKALSLNHPQGEKLKEKMEELKKRVNY